MTFFQLKESEDLKLLNHLNESKKWFKSIKPTKEFSKFDVKAVTKDDRKCNIELKSRNMSANQFEDVFIEESKFYELLGRYYQNKEIPLYINFFNDGIVLIFNLLNVGDIEERYVTIYNKGKGIYEDVKRIALNNKKAIIVKNNE